MAIYAHPDDAEFGMAGTVAKWAKAGVRVTYCMVTNGASGSDDPEMTRARLRDERLEPHKPKALFLTSFGASDAVIDVTAVIDLKIAAIRAHRSQFGDPGVEELVRGMMRAAGKPKGYAYAEAYRVIRLDASFAERAGSAARRAPRARARPAVRSTRTARRGRPRR